MRAGERRSFSVLMVDRAGRAIEGTPVQLKWGSRATEGESARMARRGFSHESRLATEPVAVGFDQPGRYEIIAVLGVRAEFVDSPGTHADTVNVDVMDAPKR
jgi:hypothetical protein